MAFTSPTLLRCSVIIEWYVRRLLRGRPPMRVRKEQVEDVGPVEVGPFVHRFRQNIHARILLEGFQHGRLSGTDGSLQLDGEGPGWRLSVQFRKLQFRNDLGSIVGRYVDHRGIGIYQGQKAQKEPQ